MVAKVVAAERCPARVNIVENESLSKIILQRVSEVYRSLGCDTHFPGFPGRRSIAMFNKHHADGELARLQQIDKIYTRPFVRSEVPVHVTTMSLWQHPDRARVSAMPTGFMHGIIWEEEYAKNHSNMKKFYSDAEMFKAYREHNLSGFLANNEHVARLKPKPVQKERLLHVKLYHFLGAEFAPFMKELSKALRK
jgi:hypothetical protein